MTLISINKYLQAVLKFNNICRLHSLYVALGSKFVLKIKTNL